MRLERRYASAAQADRLLRALAADQPEYVHAEHEGAVVRFTVEGASAASLRATLEDLVACLQSAEGAEALSRESLRPSGATPTPEGPAPRGSRRSRR